jgi:hypothetical protein
MAGIELDGMSVQDKRDLYNRLALDFAVDAKTTPWTRLETDTWNVLCLVCPDAEPATMATRINSYGRKRYAEKCAFLEAFIDNSCAPAMRLVQRNAVRRSLLDSLVRWMREADIVVCLPSLLNSMAYLPGAVDQDFPGYSQCRLLHRVAQAMAA